MIGLPASSRRIEYFKRFVLFDLAHLELKVSKQICLASRFKRIIKGKGFLMQSNFRKFEGMKKIQLFAVTILIAVGFVACKEDVVMPCEVVPDTLRIDVQPVYDGATLQLDETYTTPEGYDIQFTDIKFYFQDVRNGTVLLSDAMLFDYRERGTLLYNGTGKAADFSALTGNIGVDASVNHNDPSAFSASSWLNISNSNDMHWDWNPGYIFMKVEARVDTIPDGTALFDHFVIFHCGKDENLQSVAFSGLTWSPVSDKSHQTTWQLDLHTFLQGTTQSIDVKTEHSSHSSSGQEALTLKVMQNFKESLIP